jgi:acetolactate synthase-1/2/3 large subunit
MTPRTLTGAQAIWESLLLEGVEVIFGYPGGATLPIYDALVDYTRMHHVLVRHEANAIFAADGFARATGRTGVCLATSGPGATNLITGLANAMADSSPVVAIVGQVQSGLVGGDAFQETDITGITLPITKHNRLVTKTSEIGPAIKEAFYLSRLGRPGPVLVDICKDAQAATAEFSYPATVSLQGRRPRQGNVAELVEKAAGMLAGARQPVIVAGHGVALANGCDELRQLAEKSDAPVVSTLLGIGVLPESHRLNLGMAGMHGHAWANQAVQSADLLVAFGMRFDDRFTGNVKHFAPNAQVVHVDIDAAEIGKNVPTDVGIVGDARHVLQVMLPKVAAGSLPAWHRQIAEWRRESQERDLLVTDDLSHLLLAPYVVREIWRETHGNALVVTDVGQHQMWAAQYYRCDQPNQLITSGGLGSMGFSMGAAMGAKMGRPDREVWVVVGDGGFQMCSMELATYIQEGLDIKIALMNNGYLGMVRQWQELQYNRRYSATPISGPDFCKLAEAYGVPATRVDTRQQVGPAIRQAREQKGPMLVEFRVEAEVNVFPMVAPGRGLHEMMRRPKSEMVFAAK